MSTIKVDTVRPVTTDGSLSLKGDSGGSATTNGISVDSSGDTSITGTTTIATADINGGTIDGTTLGSTVVFPAGHVLRTFYDESSSTNFSITTSGTLYSELDITIPSGASTSDYILINLCTNGIYNNGTTNAYMQIGLKYSTDNWSTSTSLGTVEFYGRAIYVGGATFVIGSSSIMVRVNHPTASEYRIRPWYEPVVGTMNINQGVAGGTGPRSTMTIFEIKG